MTSFLTGELAVDIADALSDIFLDATLTRGATAYPCKAIFNTWQRYPGPGGALTAPDCTILVLAATLAVQPAAGDAIQLQGESYVVFSGVDAKGAVSTDPARATWTLICKKIPLQGGAYAASAAIAAALGQPFDQYRPAGASNPLAAKLQTFPAQFVANTASTAGRFNTPNAYGKPLWQVLADGSQLQVGDYLIGASGRFFIAAMQPLLPILAVECNRTISVSTAGVDPTDGAADAGYLGNTAAKNALPGDDIMNGWPASVLQGSKGEATPEKLPSDTRAAWWSMLLPAVAGVQIRYGNLITDDLGRSYTVSSAELTDLGWRLSAAENHP